MKKICTLLLVVSAFTALSGCHWMNQKLGLNDDNWAEEVVEEIIDAKTGLDIDLTPGSKER